MRIALNNLFINNKRLRQLTGCLFFSDDQDQLTAENTDDSNHECDKVGAPLREQDRFLPIANVAKIMKRAIPESGKVNNKV